jgi:hypothetical protein
MSEVDPLWKAFLEVAGIHAYRDKWIHELKWLQLIKIRHPELADVTDEEFCRVVRKEAKKVGPDNFERKNSVGIFMVEYSFSTDPITKKKRNHSHYFYAMNKKRKPVRYPEEKTGGPFVKRHNQDVIPLDAAQPTNKPKRSGKRDASPSLEVSPSKHQKVASQLGPDVMSYWHSKECRNIFVRDPLFGGDVRKVLNDYRGRLLDALDNHRFKGIVSDLDDNNQDTLLEYDKFALLEMAAFVAKAYYYAIENMGTLNPETNRAWKWDECCCLAVKDLNSSGFVKTKQSKKVREWSKMFVYGGGKFAHPRPEKLKPRKYVPDIFKLCPESKEMILNFCEKNLQDFTVEKLQIEFKQNILPKLKRDALNSDYIDHLKNNIPCIGTMNRWVRDGLEWGYGNQKKDFYCDKHEAKEQKVDRNDFVVDYVEDFEPRMHRWIQLTEAEVDKAIEEKNLPKHMKKFGKKYDAEDGTPMMQFHVDDHKWLFEKGHNDHKLGATINMLKRLEDGRAGKRPFVPLILWGHDECSFNQYLMRVKTWITKEGKRPINPKSMGESYMVSAITCREFGFALELDANELRIVNEYRARPENMHYQVRTDAAREVSKSDSTVKPKLESTPFIRYFASGSKYEGYWNNSHFMIQMEDVMDCLACLPRFKEFEHKMLIDSSTGHRMKREDGLDADKMGVDWGGISQAQNMHSVRLPRHEGYTGEHLSKIPENEAVAIPCDYHFNFKPNDIGPTKLSPAKRQSKKHDKPKPGTRMLNGQELRNALVKAGVATRSQLSNGPAALVAALRRLAEQHNIPVAEGIVDEGWLWRPKGLFQVLWERGFIDPDNIKEYKKVHEDPKYSLRDLMASCKDFREEKTFIQHVASKYNIEIIYTPKYHAEIAGCGIEYIWGAAKAKYRSMPLKDKDKRDKFIDSIKEALNVITTLTARKCDRKARTYILAYYTLEVKNVDADGIEREDDQETTLPDIKKLVKAYRAHRSALDFDYKFIRSLIDI